MRGVALTPEQRAERNAARRVLARRVARHSALGTLALVVLLALFAWWLLSTFGGRDFLLTQIVTRLPEGTTLTWQQAEGPASGPLTLHGVRFEMTRAADPDCVATAGKSCASGRIVFTAQTIVLDPALRPLLGRRLRLDALDIIGATLEVPKSDTPFELPRWPESLPQIAPPLALQADTIRIDGLRVTGDGQPLIDIRRARGGLDAATGKLHVEHLAIDSDHGRFSAHGDYAPRDDYRTDLVVTAVLPAPAGRTPPRLGLVARGDLSRMDVALSGNVPAPLRATLTLRGKDDPSWHLRTSSHALDPALLMGSGEASTPLAFDLQADGKGGDARLRGRIARGDLVATIQPSHISLADQVLTVQPLVIDTFDGRITLRGRADLRDHDHANLRFAVNARGLTWGGADDTPAITADANFGIAGKPDAWAAIGKATLVRARQRAQVRFDGRGNDARMTLKSLTATMPTGKLEARGDVAWSPALGWKLDATLAGFDPGYFAAGWNGAIDGKLASTGSTRADGGLDVTVDAAQLGGRLRGRPLQGRGHFVMRGAATPQGAAAYAGDVALTLGGSRIDAKGTIAQTLDVAATFSPLQLGDLLPDAAGVLRGTLRLTGARNAPDVAADMVGNGLKYGDYRADTFSAKGRLPWRGGNGQLAVRASGLQAGLPFDTLRLDARGAVESLQLDADARGDIGVLALAGNASKRGNTWQGALASLQLTPTRGAQWRLQQPAQFRWTSSTGAGRSGALSNACLASSGGGTLCATADWPRHGLDINGQGLPLTLALPYLPEREDGRPWLLRGEIALTAQVRPVGNSWRGTARITSASGGMKNSERARSDLVAYDNLVLDATFDPQRLDAKLGAALIGNGRIDAHIDTGWDEYAPLRGEIALNTDELTWMELLSPDIVEPTGKLDGRITLAGTRAQPALGGQAHLSNFDTELPALAITLSNGDVRMDAQPDGSARIHGSLRSGDGTLNLDGTLGWRGTDTPLVLNVRGKNVLVSDTRDLRAVADPDVVVRYSAGQPITVTGTVGVPSARIDLERLDQGVSASPDVVVLDPVDPQRSVATPLDLDLTLALGDDVRLHGFGLDGTLGGSLRVRARPGREMVATGALEVGGRYTAYGQKLDITRGRLLWSNTAIADPLLDIRAERETGAVTAGIDVTGRASRPQAEVWTDPASNQSEALAYLALGRPLSSASADESRQLDAASAALSAGGSLLASQLGAKIGLDAAGVTESRALGGSVLGVGKYLSPKLYVGYGVSLLGTGQVLTLKYLLRKGFDIEIESSTVENRASANWRKEK
ncbi:MAG TPA: translocation/assembly module TamB domain-containing protein [Luteimonas sp.]|nr:translocation/assembly module TamB domain-containing protein [Luteimonas sp.]